MNNLRLKVISEVLAHMAADQDADWVTHLGMTYGKSTDGLSNNTTDVLYLLAQFTDSEMAHLNQENVEFFAEEEERIAIAEALIAANVGGAK